MYERAIMEDYNTSSNSPLLDGSPGSTRRKTKTSLTSSVLRANQSLLNSKALFCLTVRDTLLIIGTLSLILLWQLYDYSSYNEGLVNTYMQYDPRRLLKDSREIEQLDAAHHARIFGDHDKSHEGEMDDDEDNQLDDLIFNENHDHDHEEENAQGNHDGFENIQKDENGKLPYLIVNEMSVGSSERLKEEIIQFREQNKEKIKNSIADNPYASMDRLLKLPPNFGTPDEHPMTNFYQRRDYPLLISNDDLCNPNSFKNSNRRPTAAEGKNNGKVRNDFPCKNKAINLLIAIKSGCRNIDRRNAIRQTWGNRNYVREEHPELNMDARVIFLLGACKKAKNEKNRHSNNNIIGGFDEIVHVENKEHQDMIQWDFEDTFQNLTVKEVLFLQWQHNHCQGITHIFKGDDDIFMNPHAISKLILEHERTSPKKMFTGSVLNGSPRILDWRSKYFCPSDLWPEKSYPPYVSGGGYVFSKEIADKLFLASLNVRIFPIDDAFVGVLLKNIDYKPESVKGFMSWGAKEEKRNEKCFWHWQVKTFHRKLPNELLAQWKRFQAEMDMCSV